MKSVVKTTYIARKMKFTIKDFFSKCDQEPLTAKKRNF